MNHSIYTVSFSLDVVDADINTVSKEDVQVNTKPDDSCEFFNNKFLIILLVSFWYI